MTRFLSKPRPSPAGRRGNPQESAGIRLAGKRPEQGIPAVIAGAPDRTRTCAHGSGICALISFNLLRGLDNDFRIL